MTDRLLERLTDLGQHMEWPTADISPDVLRRVEQPSRGSLPVRRWAVPAVVAAAVLVVMAIPAGRSVIADLLGVVGIEVQWADSLAPTGELDESDFGRAVGLEQVDIPILVPDTDPPGLPDRVYVDDGRVVTVWGMSPELPAIVGTEIGLLHLQFAATLDEELLAKRVVDSEIGGVTVRGRSGIWIEDGPHVVTYLDSDGRERTETTRFAGNVLMWEENGVTHRIESSLSLEDTLAIAESLTAR